MRFDASYCPAREVAVVGETTQGASVSQLFTGSGIQFGALAEILDIDERTSMAGRLDAPRNHLAQPADQVQAQADCRLLFAAWLQSAVPIAAQLVADTESNLKCLRQQTASASVPGQLPMPDAQR